MTEHKETKKLGRDQLERIIELCHQVEEKGLDPFIVEVDDVIQVIKTYFPEWKNPEELCLDAEALHQIASAIKLQSEFITHRSTSLYTDPFLITAKLTSLPKKKISNLFLKAWHPIVELEQMSSTGLAEAVGYWKNLIPLGERWLQKSGPQLQTGTTTLAELENEDLIAEEEFQQELDTFLEELKQATRDQKNIEYWSFIGADSFRETARRAYLMSFLVTYGYATFEVDHMEEIIYVKPDETRRPNSQHSHAASFPISVGFDDWQKWREGAQR
ncbi:MAG: hypothetical protein JSV35_01565 [Candidatus Bathyarchaeota archaeon]|nr:MAG: hypothetical protein JSV35_01565 [Candidatus Bathyarchaeota archaeon]